MNEEVVSKFIGKNVEAEIKTEDVDESFVVKGELTWDNATQLNQTNNKVTIAKEDEAISVDCSDIINLSLKKED